MVNYDKSVGTAGTMRISDSGTTVSFIIMCSDGATNSGSYTWSGTVNGVAVGGTTSLSAGFGSKTLGSWTVSSSQTVTFKQNATGTQGLGGATTHTASISRGSAPGAPGTPVVSNLTQTSAKFTWTAAANNGATITNYGVYISVSPTFSTHVFNAWIGTGLTYTYSSLTPGTQYYVRVRAQNSVGIGSYSSTTAFGTNPNVAPGLAVASSPSGTSALITVTPPAGSTGITQYQVERLPVEAGVPNYLITPPATTTTVTGLLPGNTYQWRVRAMFGTDASPWSGYTTVTQLNPNTSPGDYFDGSTAPKNDTTYAWTGTANNSTSTASGFGVIGWTATFSNGATGTMMRSTGGYTQGFSARVIFNTDATTMPGLDAGIDPATGSARAAVGANANYTGSIYVNPTRPQRLQARIQWYNAGGADVGAGHAYGAETVVPANTWTRVVVSGLAPVGAVSAIVRVSDIAGTSGSPWLAGDMILLDAAMVSLGSLLPYFDGATTDTTDFNYAWTGAVNASTSTRTTILADPGAALIDPDCVTIPAPPRPPVIIDDCIVSTGTWRRYWSSVPSEVVSDWVTMILSLEIDTGSLPARQVRIRVYPNPFGYSPALIDSTGYCAEQIVSYIPPYSRFHIDGVSQRAWAEVQGGAPVGADHLLYGSNGTPATWPELSCGIPYLVSLDVPTDAPEGNMTQRVFLTERV